MWWGAALGLQREREGDSEREKPPPSRPSPLPGTLPAPLGTSRVCVCVGGWSEATEQGQELARAVRMTCSKASAL